MPFVAQVVNAAHSDGNQQFSQMGVIGTLGTSDIGGTALTLPVAVDVTGAIWQREIGTPTVILTGGTLQSGTIGNINSIGTLGTMQLGSVQVIGGTINAGTFTTTGTNVNIVTGSLVGTLLGGTLQNLATGTLNALAAGTITTGTVSVTIGTITGKDANAAAITAQPIAVGGTDSGGTVRNQLIDATGVGRSTGSQVITVGTITTGTLQNLVSGTVNALAAGTITGGTLQNLVTGTINALASGTITTGTISMTTGTLNGGTLTNLVSGTFNSGTVVMTTGTLSPLPTIANAPFGTIGTTGASVFGTLAGGTSSGAGTEIFITSLSLTIPATAGSQDVSIGWGTNGGTFHAGTGRLVRGMFLAGGGIQKSFWPPVNSGTNAQLTYFQAGAGTVEIDITSFTTTSTL